MQKDTLNNLYGLLLGTEHTASAEQSARLAQGMEVILTHLNTQNHQLKQTALLHTALGQTEKNPLLNQQVTSAMAQALQKSYAANALGKKALVTALTLGQPVSNDQTLLQTIRGGLDKIASKYYTEHDALRAANRHGVNNQTPAPEQDKPEIKQGPRARNK